MAGKKKSRATSRCKHTVLSNVTNNGLTVQEAKELKKKKELIVEDFRKNVALRVEQLREEQEQLKESLMQVYVNYRHKLQPWSAVTVQELFQSEEQCMNKKGKCKPLALTTLADTKCQDEVITDEAQEPLTTAVVVPYSEDSSCKQSRPSEITALLMESKMVATATGKATKRKAAAAAAAAGALTATRTSSRAKRAPGGASAMLAPPTILAPPATARAPRNKKLAEAAAFVTPAGQRVMLPARGAMLLVTPKFDPRVPLPPGTVRRRPLPNEVPMSVTGSPLTLSPARPQLKTIMDTFLKTLESEVPDGDMRRLHSALDRFIDARPKE